MIVNLPFFVAAGNVPDCLMRAGSTALARVWGLGVEEFSYLDSPRKVLNSLPKGKSLGCLLGDVAINTSKEGSWLECLGAWRKPVVFFVRPLPSGEIPGAAYAYTALCRQYDVQLLGIVQLGGSWELDRRRLDNLPWCGWLNENEKSIKNSIYLEEVIENLKKRMIYM